MLFIQFPSTDLFHSVQQTFIFCKCSNNLFVIFKAWPGRVFFIKDKRLLYGWEVYGDLIACLTRHNSYPILRKFYTHTS